MSSAASGHEVAAPELQRLSIVVPVDQGERTLDLLLAEIAPLTTPQETPQGRPFQVVEVVLVHDGAIDNSHVVMEALAARFPFVFLVWLSRNFGQHPATLAGMAATSADWVATLDEDGQQNPADIARLLDAAFDAGAPLVYGQALNEPSHGVVRNTFSGLAKTLTALAAGDRQLAQFNSFRLVRGDIARSLQKHLGRIAHVQLADNPGRNEPGTGEINYPFLFRHLDAIGYRGWVGCEYKPRTTTVDGLGWHAAQIFET